MKLSNFLLTTLLASAVISVQAQTIPVKPKDKKKVKTVTKKAVKADPKQATAVVKNNDKPRPISANYCPPCGRG